MRKIMFLCLFVLLLRCISFCGGCAGPESQKVLDVSRATDVALVKANLNDAVQEIALLKAELRANVKAMVGLNNDLAVIKEATITGSKVAGDDMAAGATKIEKSTVAPVANTGSGTQIPINVGSTNGWHATAFWIVLVIASVTGALAVRGLIGLLLAKAEIEKLEEQKDRAESERDILKGYIDCLKAK